MPFSPWWFLLVIPLLPLFLFLNNPKAFVQKHNEVVIRPPGARRLAPQPTDARPKALEHLEFAWLSQAAYEKSTTKAKLAARTCPDPEASLRERGWKEWTDFPDEVMHKQFDISHLRVQVWTNSTEKKVAVSFGGTVFTSGKDWKSNLRWFTFKHHDEYTDLVGSFVPKFAERLALNVQKPEWAFLKEARFYTTGHSLGGGLAQQLAYAQQQVPGIPRITMVYAFDPSPVTGYYTVKKGIRESNERGLTIERIYERFEILALLRSLTSFFHKPSEHDPTTQQVRYSLFTWVNPIAGHSMSELACRLSQAAAGTLPK